MRDMRKQCGAIRLLKRLVTLIGIVWVRISYHWTEYDYIIDLEAILDARNYITFSKMNSQRLM